MLPYIAAFGSPSCLGIFKCREVGVRQSLPHEHRARPRTAPRASATVPQLPPGDLPAFMGKGPVSAFANMLISVPPVFDAMRAGARHVIISGAEKNGVKWREDVSTLDEQFSEEERENALDEITDKGVAYPDYFLQPFHAYVEGNLAWKPAFEADAATRAMGLRVWKHEPLSAAGAAERLREGHMDIIFREAPEGWATRQNFTAVDVGCGVGVSTGWLSRRLRRERTSCSECARILGLDASPYFLAVARRLGETQGDSRGNSEIEYCHALAEDSGLEDSSVDWWSMQFVVHELPSKASQEILSEAFRILKTGGVVSLVDNNPRSPVIQGLPPVIATLMKSTEPHSDEYYTTDFAALLTGIGFSRVVETASDPRHRTIVGIK